jgi:hypothetical protein
MLIPALILVAVVGLFPVVVKVGVNLAQRHERNGLKKSEIATKLKIAG